MKLPAWIVEFFEESAHEYHTVSEYRIEDQIFYLVRYHFSSGFNSKSVSLFDGDGKLLAAEIRPDRERLFTQRATLVRTLEANVKWMRTCDLIIQDGDGTLLHRNVIVEEVEGDNE